MFCQEKQLYKGFILKKFFLYFMKRMLRTLFDLTLLLKLKMQIAKKKKLILLFLLIQSLQITKSKTFNGSSLC